MTIASERSIFLEAIEFEDARQRKDFVDRACAGSPLLRDSVVQLLAAHELPENVLDQAIVSGELINGFANIKTLEEHDESQRLDHIGLLVGPFRLMEQIGEGGFGLVFVAQQEQPVKRKVALKIIKPGTGSKEVIARFELERQALAMMDHPHIARVFDAGVTEDARPYFVMELVRGLPITDYCDNYQLTIEARIRLFDDVCSAVQHAHQKGVIHRDLKPSNVMVTLHDDKPVVKVIDFGVAKAIGSSLTDRTIYTRFYSMIGTPLYMSPEQAQMSGLDVDTRSDIYALGVVLYELLVGTTPFERERLDSVGFDELRQIIREEDPPIPSDRLSTLGKRMTTIAESRRTIPSRLSSSLRGDLDWIVMKSLEKDRNRRYESAAALAADLKRYLDQQPIEARPPSALYQLSKFARRNRTTLLTTGIIATTLVIGSIFSLWQMLEAISERDKKDVALRKALIAEQEATAARLEIELFAQRLTEANLLTASGQAHAENELWSEAYEDLTQATDLQPNYYLPWVLRGQLHARLSLWSEAAADYARALELGAPVDEPQWWGVPALFLFTDRSDVFTKLEAKNQSILDESTTKPKWNTLRGLLIAPSPLADQYPVLTSRWLTEDAPPPRLFEDPFGVLRKPRPKPNSGVFSGRRERGDKLPPFIRDYITGLAHLRAGRLAESIRRLESAGRARDWPAVGAVGAPLAIALHQSGRTQEAEEILNRSDDVIENWISAATESPIAARSNPWFDLIEALQFHREATQLITGSPPELKLSLQQLRQASLAKIQVFDAL